MTDREYMPWYGHALGYAAAVCIGIIIGVSFCTGWSWL